VSTVSIARRVPLARWTAPRSIGVLSIFLGIVATWLALPPIASRAVAWPLALGVLALAAGIWAVTHGAGRVGWGGVAAALIGTILGLFAIRSGTGNLDLVFAWPVLLGATLRYATPLTFASIGGLFSERSGVVNIGLEGMMLMGAFFGFYGADRFGSWPLGLVCAMVAGAALETVAP